MDLPDLNKRIKKIIDNQTDGVVKKFAEIVNLPQQTLNRLFIIDKRTGKYPIATTEILQKISEMYDFISPEWLLTGNGDMLRTQNSQHTPGNSLQSSENQCKNTKNKAIKQEKTVNGGDNISRLISILQQTLAEKDKQIDRLLDIIKDLSNNK